MRYEDENIWLTQKIMATLYEKDFCRLGIREEFSYSKISNNCRHEFELNQLNRMVNSYLDFAENMTQRKIPLTMQDWETRLNSFIEMFEYGLLKDAGKVSAAIAKLHA